MAKLAAAFEYTDQELLDLAREAYAKIMKTGQSVTVAGQQFNRVNAGKLLNMISTLETRVSTSTSGLIMASANLNRR